MVQVTVRNVPEDVIATLKGEAEEDGVSLNAVLRTALVERAEQWRRIARMRRAVPRLDALRRRVAEEQGAFADSTPFIREDRER